MNKKLLPGYLTFVLPVLFFSGCAEEKTTEPPDENTLLYSSFEKDGQPSADGWSLPTGSKFVNDVPSGGGNYSLELPASQPPEEYAEIKVPVKTQFNNYQLTFQAKHEGIEGRAVLSLVRDGSVIKSAGVLVDGIIWRSYSFTDTFSVAAGDSFMVQLTGGITQLLPGKTYFDLCRLRAIE
jgi:hypothetical protein